MVSTVADSYPASSPSSTRPRPVVGPRLRPLLLIVFALFGALAVNGLYLGGVTLLEWWSGAIYQGYFYQVMFLVHLILGLLLLIPAVVFGALHLRNARRRPNRRAVRAGLALYVTALVLLVSGLALTRFDFFELRDPEVREVVYWLHLVTPFAAAWLFVLHRLAGRAIRWQVGAGWAGAAVAFSLAMLLVQAPDAGQEGMDPEAYRGDAFRPSLAKTVDGELIAAKSLMMDAYCLECHPDDHSRWSHSAHRFSSFNNPAYLFSVREVRKVTYERDGDTRTSRFCAGCHDLVPLFSGAFDDPDFDDRRHPTANAGITCSGCHAITNIDSPRGNADYTIAEPVHYPFAYSDNPVLAWINRQLVKAKPEFHKKTFLKPLHRSPELCGTCHKVHLPEALNDYKWLRGQDHFDAYLLSGVSGHGASSFYYPPRAIPKCAACHMPLRPSDDFGAAVFEPGAGRQVHDHGFLGANTALPYMLDLPPEVNQAHADFLAGALRVDIFGLKRGERIDAELAAPLRPELPVLTPGEEVLLETVIRTTGVGHTFTQGTADSNQVWVELRVTDAQGRLLARSGGLDKEGTVDPWSHFINAYVLDRDGNRVDRRNAQDIFTVLYNHQIPPGAADVVHYALRVPEDARGPLTVEAEVKYRKFDTRYLRYIQGPTFVRNDLPIVTLATDRLQLPLAGDAAAPGAARTGDAPVGDIAPWERWNDYGIALLRKGGQGQLRQAEAAFRRVEQLGQAHGPLNLARVYLREGRLEDAARALERVSSHPRPIYPWVAAWLGALVNKQNGYLDRSIAALRRLAATDFAEARRRGFDFGRDYRLLNELGQTLFERAKQERGEARRASRLALLEESRDWFLKTLDEDPENAVAHYNLALVYTRLGAVDEAARHRALHDRYRPDDNARDRVVALHRRRNPAADHAAEAVVVYDLQRPGAYGLAGPATAPSREDSPIELTPAVAGEPLPTAQGSHHEPL
jgi:tetratricopeptide (TPR) repeat protein